MRTNAGSRRRFLFSAFAVLALIALGGCGDRKENAPGENDVPIAEMKGEAPLDSAHWFLAPKAIKEFQQGRPRIDILKDIDWWGAFDLSGPLEEGHTGSIITYSLYAESPGDEGGEAAFAVFIDDKFVKFVKWLPYEMIDVPYEGTTHRQPKPIEIGDVSWLVRAVASEPIDLEDLQKELKLRPGVPSETDPGLTIAYILLKSQGLTPAQATEKDYRRNAQLRDQFNAARLKLGMSPKEVRAVFKAKALESGEVPAGTFEVYGSTESFNIDPALLYSNVLVLYQEGKATVIYGIEGGSDWRRKAQERFVDLPEDHN